MKAIMISIRKEHNEKIFGGVKRFEGRKTLPTVILLGNHIDNTTIYNPSEYDVICYVYEPKTGGGCGKVVGQFVCDFAQSFHTKYANMLMVARALCVSVDFAKEYFNREKGYMLRVCDPKRYDKPKELSEFYVEGDCDCMNCRNCAWFDRGNGYNVEDDCNLAYKGADEHKSYKPIKRPPQSWCYCEELKGETE